MTDRTPTGMTPELSWPEESRSDREPMMTPEQFDGLMTFLNEWFDRIDRRFDSIEAIDDRIPRPSIEVPRQIEGESSPGVPPAD